MFHTVICDLLGIQYPIIQGAMGGIRTPQLAAAVSNAGGLGVLATWERTVEEIREDIRQTRALTFRPFAVNIMPLGAAYTMERARLVIDEGIRIVTTGRGDPRDPVVTLLKQHGAIVIPVVPTVRHAKRMADEGADAVVASGCEAGGHVGKVSTLPLIPQVVDAVKIPVIAAGGIGDARGFVAMLALGACGVQIGTRFLATYEAGVSDLAKEKIVRASEEDTLVSPILTGKPVRLISEPDVLEYEQRQRNGASEEELRQLATEIRRQGKQQDGGYAVVAGQISGLIRGLERAEDVVRDIVEGAQGICDRLAILARQ